MGLYVLVIFLAFGGFAISAYIRNKKKKAKPMICPMKGNCHAVTSSKFSRFLGMPVELLGMLYYGLLAIGYGLIVSLPVAAPLAYILLAITTGGFLFSLYLTFIQLFTIRQICTWCFASAGITTAIFAVGLFAGIDVVVPYLEHLQPLLITLNFIGLGIGIGAATVSDTLSLRFLRDFRISELESDIIQTIFQITWLGLAIIVISQLGLYLTDVQTLNATPTFQVKMIALLVMIASGWLLNLNVAPRLVDISFRKKHKHHKGELHNLRRWSFGLGSFWVVSWYCLLLLTVTPLAIYTFSQLLAVYLLFLLVGLVGSQVIERYYVKRANAIPHLT